MKVQHDNYLEETLPIKCPVPTKEHLVRLYSDIYKPLAHLLRPVFESCAEETERHLLRIFRTESTEPQDYKAIITIQYENYSYPDRSDIKARRHRYHCACGYDRIRLEYKCCPICGREIEWVGKRIPMKRGVKSKH